jgi:hypothetical protein
VTLASAARPTLAAAIAAFSARTTAAGLSGWPHTAPITARKSALACTSGAQFAAVMPPIAQHGRSISLHLFGRRWRQIRLCRRSSSASLGSANWKSPVLTSPTGS